MRTGTNGKRLIIAGLLVIAAALFLTVYNLYDGVRAASATNNVLVELKNEIGTGSDDYMADEDIQMPVYTLEDRDYACIIEIPDIGTVLPVINETSNGNLKTAPCRYSGSIYQDNLVIAAHNYRSHFGKIKTLSQGAPVYIVDMDGNVFEYEVKTIEVLQPTAVAEMKDSEWDLTLFTCTVGGQARVTVRCEKR